MKNCFVQLIEYVCIAFGKIYNCIAKTTKIFIFYSIFLQLSEYANVNSFTYTLIASQFNVCMWTVCCVSQYILGGFQWLLQYFYFQNKQAHSSEVETSFVNFSISGVHWHFEILTFLGDAFELNSVIAFLLNLICITSASLWPEPLFSIICFFFQTPKNVLYTKISENSQK